ncbi:flagellar basal-body rod protein FlgC [Mariprofundus ferrinatatus]|uniref:Flagellar basal-body rod protein FlgC n=1 Tax=Mariprofundus ferrinatatus TaxID=1921087 RepID=A0A2K8LAI5_9PROT|nr:flagellar basal body rod protein FlgC [Mariprofundus ferrinatatus]ATX82921.1 flagellar basal-body rod protein FlgC [Mariprofundus ferrinatatus]
MADSLLNSMHISAAGMSAQRSRMDVVAENIANAESTRTEDGGPYQRRQVIFETVAPQGSFSNVFSSSLKSNQHQTVKVADVVKDSRPPQELFDPSHPDADSNGMVKFPNVNTVEEMVDLNSASRGFESNVTVMQASKRMFLKTIELLR